MEKKGLHRCNTGKLKKIIHNHVAKKVKRAFHSKEIAYTRQKYKTKNPSACAFVSPPGL